MDPRVRLYRQPRNMGKGAALRRGLAAARAPFVVVQDADLEYDPADYETLLRPLLEGVADVVYGSRFHNSRPHRVFYFWHAVGNRLLTALSNMVTNLNLTDMETCYKASVAR
jgi:glycosyltransferase involved in cell wall biosynthesis